MKVKIFSVRADENFRAIRIGEETGKLSANEYLEDKIQKFLDENPKAQIKHVQFSTVAIVPSNFSIRLGGPTVWKTLDTGLRRYDGRLWHTSFR